MIIVHHLEMSRSQRVLWLLEELGLPYEIRHYPRDPKTRLAPPELKRVHPLGKSPVISDGELVLAESGAILEYLAETYNAGAQGDVAHLLAPPGSAEHRQLRFWMHYAEGSLMNWLVMKLVFMSIPRQPMPFFVRPIARKLCATVIEKLIDPNLASAKAFIEDHLAHHAWFAGERRKRSFDTDLDVAVSVEVLRATCGMRPDARAAASRSRRRIWRRGVSGTG